MPLRAIPARTIKRRPTVFKTVVKDGREITHGMTDEDAPEEDVPVHFGRRKLN